MAHFRRFLLELGDAPMLERLGNRRPRRVRVRVEMLAPYMGRVDDPCCGPAGMFVQSEKCVEEHVGRIGDIAVYG